MPDTKQLQPAPNLIESRRVVTSPNDVIWAEELVLSPQLRAAIQRAFEAGRPRKEAR